MSSCPIFPPIPQLDGLHSHPPLTPLPYSSHQQEQQPTVQPKNYTFPQPNVHFARNAHFKLDKNKQLKKLKDDSTLADYNIEISQKT